MKPFSLSQFTTRWRLRTCSKNPLLVCNPRHFPHGPIVCFLVGILRSWGTLCLWWILGQMRWKGYKADPSSPLCIMIGCQLPMEAWETWRWNCSMATTKPCPSCSTVWTSSMSMILPRMPQDWFWSFIRMKMLNTGKLRNSIIIPSIWWVFWHYNFR